MKAHTIEWTHPHRSAAQAKGLPLRLPSRALQASARFLALLVAALALLVGGIWMSASAGLAPYLLALLWSGGFVFLALAVEADGAQASLLLASTGAVLPVLAWLGSRAAPEFAVVGIALVATWLLAAGVRGPRVFSA